MTLALARTGMIAIAAALASGCAVLEPKTEGPRPVVSVDEPAKSEAWMAIASAADERRLANAAAAWAIGLAEARKANFTTAIRDEKTLLEPNAALPRPAPTPGSYNCRLVSLGSTTRSKPAFERFKPFFCYVEVEGDLLTIVKQTGSQRPAGRLWEDDAPTRLVFLGSLALGNEEAPIAYGDDSERDMAGYFERIGPFRWRLVIPWPQDGAKLDVFELTPVANQPE